MVQFLREKQLIKAFCVTRGTVNYWRTKNLPFIKMANGAVLYPIEEVKRWVENNSTHNLNEKIYQKIISEALNVNRNNRNN